jgi:hypothetical protein
VRHALNWRRPTLPLPLPPRNGCAPSHQAINGGPPVCRSTASAASPLLPSPPIKAAPEHLFNPHRSLELPLSSTPPPQGGRTGAPPLVVDLLCRRFSFLFEQLGETPCLSYLFWCLFLVV